jgi:1-acyl-sn-glycerol-3-phosphate acyltransferase
MQTAARRLEGEYAEDEWGLDEEFVSAVEPLFGFLYDRWWRVRTIGAAHVPAGGRALLAANHAGIVPWDAMMMSTAIQRDHPLPRRPRFLVLNWAFELPYASVAIRKLGGVVASPYNALRLLEQDRLVAVFPEGVKGAGKPFRERYRLQRFGRGGFVEVALRTGAPIVPVAVVGSEEIYPKRCRCPRSGGSSSASRSTRPATAPPGPRTARWCSSCPSASGRRFRASSTRTSVSADRPGSER